MKFIESVPNIKISQNNQYILEIRSVQKFNEDENKIILKCAEEVVDFKRGFVCDMECSFQLVEVNVSKNNVVNERIDIIKDLVLVYINKDTQYGYVPDFEYVFYK